MRPTNIGRLCRGKTCETMTVDPLKMPAELTPAMAQQTINALELGASPHIVDPASNTITAAMNINLAE